MRLFCFVQAKTFCRWSIFTKVKIWGVDASEDYIFVIKGCRGIFLIKGCRGF